MSNKQGYRDAFKSTTIFGGLQVFTTLVSIAKSKLVALWLGPIGFGLLGIFNSAVDTIYTATNLGATSSSVRDIASNEQSGDMQSKSMMSQSLLYFIIILGAFGALLTSILSKRISVWSFKNDTYTSSFIALSLAVFFTAVYKGYNAVLQGTRQIRFLAKANLWGCVFGFVLSVPLFYFFRQKGIVFSVVLSTITCAISSKYFINKAHFLKVRVPFRTILKNGSCTLQLGIMLSLSVLAATLIEFVLKIFITRHGGLTDVGFYQAGWSLNNSYLGLVFTAISMDYFPRLSAIFSDNCKVMEMVNQQGEIALLIIAPLVILLLVFLPLVIRILYTKEFLVIIPMLRLLLLGSFFKVGSWAISYIFLAKKAGKIFLFNELGICVISLPVYLILYKTFGIDGIGMAYLINFILYFIIVATVSYAKYRIKYGIDFWKIFCILLVSIIAYLVLKVLFVSLVCDILFGLWILYYSYVELNKRVDIISVIKGYLKR